MKPRQGPWFVDLFAGCGGFSKGMLDAGYRPLAANEIWAPAADTYEHNLGQHLIRGDIRDDEVFSKLLRATQGHEPLVVIGGPPCQGFSVAGNRNPLDPRAQLWKELVKFVNVAQPSAFIMENVKGLVSIKHIDENLNLKRKKEVDRAGWAIQHLKDLKRYGAQRELTPEERQEFIEISEKIDSYKATFNRALVPLLPQIIAMLSKAGSGYVVQHKIVNAANYGVPQFRERIAIIGVRNDLYERLQCASANPLIFHPPPTHADPNRQPRNGFKPYVTVQDAIRDLANKPENSVPNHVFMKSKPDFVEKIRQTPLGYSVYPHYKDAWFRLLPDQPAKTVKENHGGVHCNPWVPRPLSPRELARLQNFDDKYIFMGKKSDILVQIGNAVPPLLAKAIADHIIKVGVFSN